MVPDQPNLIVVIADTLRADHLGCYGNSRVRTPNVDAFAQDSVVFTGAYPESLPTIVFRRALHTGRRTFPFRDYRPIPWDIVYLPGWQPLSPDEDTVAENLAASGYYTGFVTDTLPYFAPGMNFTRGFWQWEYVRGKQQDRWRSPASVAPEQLIRYGRSLGGPPVPHTDRLLRHVANTSGIRSEEETTTAKVFRWASDFVVDNRHAQPLYLLVDSFAPHEPWDAPNAYVELYADPAYRGRVIIHPRYGPADGQMTAEELEHVKAHYAGLVTLFDTWFGRFVDTLKRTGLYNDSLIVLMSDHGTNLGDNPGRIIGKPATAMYPPVMNVPLLMHWPGGAGGGRRVPDLLYNVDVVATLCGASGLRAHLGERLHLDGQDLQPVFAGEVWNRRRYLTCRYGNELFYRDDRHWILFDLDGQARSVFDLEDDPFCQQPVEDVGPDILGSAWSRVMADAGGALPDYRNKPTTDAVGRPN